MFNIHTSILQLKLIKYLVVFINSIYISVVRLYLFNIRKSNIVKSETENNMLGFFGCLEIFKLLESSFH